MQKTVFINVQGTNVQAAITGMIAQLDTMSADEKWKNFELHSSTMTVTFEAPPKKSNLVPINGGVVQPVMVINHTVCLVEKINQLPGEQEMKDLKRAYQLKCPHDNLSTGGSWIVQNGERVFQVICKDCGAWVNVPGAKDPTLDAMGKIVEQHKAAMEKITGNLQVPIDPIGDQLDQLE